MIEWASWWDKTLDRWYLEGLTKNIGDDQTREYLGLDMVRQFWIRPSYHSIIILIFLTDAKKFYTDLEIII